MKNTLTLLILLSLQAGAQDFDINIFMAQHELEPYPIENIERMQYFLNIHYVSLENGQLTIKYEGDNINKLIHEESTFKYIGTDKGEFGGELKVQYLDGTEIKLMAENIVELMPIDESLYVIAGVGHLISRGSLHIIPNRSIPQTPQRLTILPEDPLHVVLHERRDSLIRQLSLVGHSGLTRVSLSEKYPHMDWMDILYWDAFWEHKMRPTSFVYYEGQYYVGLPHGVAVLDLRYSPRTIVFYANKNTLNAEIAERL